MQLAATSIGLLGFSKLDPSLSKERHLDCFIAFESVVELSYCQHPWTILITWQPCMRATSFQLAVSPVISSVNAESNRLLPHFDMRC